MGTKNSKVKNINLISYNCDLFTEYQHQVNTIAEREEWPLTEIIPEKSGGSWK